MAAMLIVPVIMMPIYTKLANRYTKTTPMHFGLVIWIIALFFSLFLKEGQNSIFIYIIAAASGIGSASAVFVPWTILADVSDVDELISGKRREGLYSGMATLLRKIAQATAIFIVGTYLEHIGYVPNSIQTPSTIFKIKIMFAIFPIILLIIALIYSYKYCLTQERHNIIINEIERRKSKSNKLPPEETIVVCEKVTGQSFKNLSDIN